MFVQQRAASEREVTDPRKRGVHVISRLFPTESILNTYSVYRRTRNKFDSPTKKKKIKLKGKIMIRGKEKVITALKTE